MHEHHHIVVGIGALSFLVSGLLGSIHCAGMCGPLSVLVHASPEKRNIFDLIPYHFGRLISYGVLGFAAAWAGTSIQPIIPTEIMLGLILLPLLLYATGVRLPHWPFFSKITTPILRTSTRLKPRWRGLTMGLCTPLLPCGLLYGMLAAATMAPTPWAGLGWMLSFCLGTIPLLGFSQAGLKIISNRLGPVGTSYFLRGCAFTTAVLSIIFYIHHATHA